MRLRHTLIWIALALPFAMPTSLSAQEAAFELGPAQTRIEFTLPEVEINLKTQGRITLPAPPR